MFAVPPQVQVGLQSPRRHSDSWAHSRPDDCPLGEVGFGVTKMGPNWAHYVFRTLDQMDPPGAPWVLQVGYGREFVLTVVH